MRTTELGRAAASAEVLRIKSMVNRQIFRAVYGAVAAIFAIGVLTLLHVCAFIAMVPSLTPLEAAAVLLVVDLVVAALFGILASRGGPSAVEIEAKQVRDQAIREMKKSVAIAALVGPVGRLAVSAITRRRK